MIKKIIKLVAFIELAVGLSTIIGLVVSVMLSIAMKPLNVFVFVISSACISTALGLGLLKKEEQARTILVFFSGYIILTKILVFSNLLQLCCEIVTAIPTGFKNGISILYHTFIIIFFTRESVKKYFTKQ